MLFAPTWTYWNLIGKGDSFYPVVNVFTKNIKVASESPVYTHTGIFKEKKNAYNVADVVGVLPARREIYRN